MTTDRSSRSAITARKRAAAVGLLALTAGLVLALAAQYPSSRPNRSMGFPMMGFERTITLGDLWNIQSSEKAKAAGEEISQPGFKIESWYPAVVPSTVLGTLVQNNVYRDIFMGRNLEKVPTEPFAVSWWYRTEFTLPEPVSIMLGGKEMWGT